MEEQRKSDDAPFLLPKDHFGGPLDEQGLVEGGFVCDDIVRAFFIDGEFSDELEDVPGLFRPDRPYRECFQVIVYKSMRSDARTTSSKYMDSCQ